MGDGNLVPISDEQAKLGQEFIKAVSGLGGWFADILGDTPKDLVGYLIGDRVKVKRVERLAALWQSTCERLQDRGTDPEPPSLKYAIPILEAAADEENEELQDLWSRLLAAAMDPNRRDAMRQSLIASVKQMDPIDVLVLKAVHNHPEEWHPGAADALAVLLKCSADEIVVSIDHLSELDCLPTSQYVQPHLKPFGKLLMKAVSG
jgi:Abortive infection alpha